jgi:hypothetical protein
LFQFNCNSVCYDTILKFPFCSLVTIAMFTTLHNVKHRVGINASCYDEGYYGIKNLAKTLGISLLTILVLLSSLSSNSLAADVIPTSIQRQQQPLQNLITKTITGSYNISTIIPSITNVAESVSPTSGNTTCPGLIDVDPGSTAYNSQNIECVRQLFNSCTPSDFLLVYGLGSVHVSIKGKKDSNKEGLCSIEFRQETEMGKSNLYSCLIPLDKIATWGSWRNADGMTALDDILSFCNDIT